MHATFSYDMFYSVIHLSPNSLDTIFAYVLDNIFRRKAKKITQVLSSPKMLPALPLDKCFCLTKRFTYVSVRDSNTS